MLALTGRERYLSSAVTAHEVIDQIKALPPEEQVKVLEFIEEVKSLLHGKQSDERDFAAAADWVFAEHADLMHKLSQ